MVVVKVHGPACFHPPLYRVPHRPGAIVQHLCDATRVTFDRPFFLGQISGELGGVFEDEHESYKVDVREQLTDRWAALHHPDFQPALRERAQQIEQVQHRLAQLAVRGIDLQVAARLRIAEDCANDGLHVAAHAAAVVVELLHHARDVGRARIAGSEVRDQVPAHERPDRGLRDAKPAWAHANCMITCQKKSGSVFRNRSS